MPDTARIDAIFERLRAHNPHPTTELVYRSPFELLVAVVLSAQATDASVNQATSRLFAAARTPRVVDHRLRLTEPLPRIGAATGLCR